MRPMTQRPPVRPKAALFSQPAKRVAARPAGTGPAPRESAQAGPAPALAMPVAMPPAASPPAAPPAQPRNPLHGVTLEAMVTALAAHYGWPGLGERIPLRCFTHEPSVTSSLKLLRRTPWAREKVEGLYLFMLREQRRGG